MVSFDKTPSRMLTLDSESKPTGAFFNCDLQALLIVPYRKLKISIDNIRNYSFYYIEQ